MGSVLLFHHNQFKQDVYCLFIYSSCLHLIVVRTEKAAQFLFVQGRPLGNRLTIELLFAWRQDAFTIVRDSDKPQAASSKSFQIRCALSSRIRLLILVKEKNCRCQIESILEE